MWIRIHDNILVGAFYLGLTLVTCCSPNTTQSNETSKKRPVGINDNKWVKKDSFPYGDIRRYGFDIGYLSPVQLDSIFDIAEHVHPITFPEGVYPIDFNIEGRSNIALDFKNVTISGKVTIQDANHISLHGKLNILDILFLRNASNIGIDTVKVRTDKKLGLTKMANRGVNVYSGSNNVSIHSLAIIDQIGDGIPFSYAQAALLIHGFQGTPTNVRIEDLIVENCGRTGVYISGRDHVFGKMKIENYGLSESKLNIKPIEKADAGEANEFKGLWLNYTENVKIDSLILVNKQNKGFYSILFDESLGHVPNIISNLSIEDNNTYKVDFNSNTLVLNEF